MTLKELAKFGSGVAAWEAVVHIAFAFNGLPIEILGITITPTINTVQIIVPAIVGILLAYYGWRKPTVTSSLG